MKESNKPYVILSAAMTIDGKIATKKGDSELSDKADWKEVHKLRTKVDAIMVGKGTILK
ncbi:MAG: dihydrofolate reductase family protein, partial [Candidatus Lokiarchaeota archaeon]|nr:dihydrofolate reductase family protein [Candidatus Lokiarchaeota archaeon]